MHKPTFKRCFLCDFIRSSIVCNGLKMLLLLSCWIIAGITAEDPPKMYYRVKNSSLCLQVVNSSAYRQESWSFNNEAIVVGETITPNYKDKVDYYPVNHSLCLNKLTETDSGTYTFSFIDYTFKKSDKKHRLIVQERLPSPVFKSGLPSNMSAGLCTITVNCSIQDDWVLSVCDEDSCRTSQRSVKKVNITVFTENRSVVCRGNNHVSTSNVSESIEAVCSRKTNPEHKETSKPPTVTLIIIAVCVFFCAFAVCVLMGFISTKCRHHQDPSPTVGLIQSQQVEEQPQALQRVSASSSSETEVCYENVEPGQTRNPPISPGEELGSQQSQKVESVYSVLQAPKGTSSLDKDGCSEDTKVHKEAKEASASQQATPKEAERPSQIDTLYSVLQKPQHHQ
ncbi:uncharacterized protein LOC121961907 [Plectropomus leopardus]|uniref:uncharacterized protein LOC121961907 n=1 Tax=Plectropomus leopardus TaxID=160734 RepID=UPI001C4DCD4E|nr:uncharacterized protein LOC121961907 [Plectropomus leopardus]